MSPFLARTKRDSRGRGHSPSAAQNGRASAQRLHRCRARRGGVRLTRTRGAATAPRGAAAARRTRESALPAPARQSVREQVTAAGTARPGLCRARGERRDMPKCFCRNTLEKHNPKNLQSWSWSGDSPGTPSQGKGESWGTTPRRIGNAEQNGPCWPTGTGKAELVA